MFGAVEIAEFLTEETGRPVKEHQVYRWSDRKILPIGRFGANLIGSRRKFCRQEDRRLASREWA